MLNALSLVHLDSRIFNIKGIYKEISERIQRKH